MNINHKSALKQISSSLLIILDSIEKNTVEYDAIELIANYASMSIRDRDRDSKTQVKVVGSE